MKTCVLIDGHSEAYRAFYAMVRTNLSVRATGEPTGAVYGFLNQLFRVLREYQPDCLVVAFDPARTFREELFAEYKATRDRMPDELRVQMRRIQDLLAALNVPYVSWEGYEADDVIGTLASRAEAEGMNVFIKTGDRDLFQLATPRTKVIYTSSRARGQDAVLGVLEVEERFGVKAEQFTEMKALQGDSSDNIPGVPGVGEKSAVKLLRQFGSIEALYRNLEQVRGERLRRNLEEHRERVALNRRLVRIVTDVDVEFDLRRAAIQPPDRQAVTALLRELELNRTLDEFSKLFQPTGLFDAAVFAPDDTGPDERTLRTARYACVQTDEQLRALQAKLEGCPVLAFDFETSSVNPLRAGLTGLAVSWEPGEAAYIPIAHETGPQLPWAEVRAALAPAFRDPAIVKVAHNAKYDLLVARRHQLAIQGPLHDSLVMAWVADPGQRRLGLKDLSLNVLGQSMVPLADLIGKGARQIPFGTVSLDRAAPYAADDAAQTLALFHHFRRKLQEEGLWDLYQEVEMPLIPILADMETRGVLLDRDWLSSLRSEFDARLTDLAADMHAIAGREFNLSSTQQLSGVLFDPDGLNLPTKGLKKLKSGAFSTAAGVLENLAQRADQLTEPQAKALDTMLEFRLIHKLKSTYVDNLLLLIDAESGRVHASFNQAGAATGRMSSNNPNLQNIPIRTAEGRRLRQAFVVPPDHVLVAADYNQVELRVLAHTADEPKLVDAFNANQDIHAITASELFGVPPDRVDTEQRGLAKTINFATIYGVSAFGLASRTAMSRSEAEEFLNRYFMTYPKVEQYIRDTVHQAAERGFVATLTGRKRHFPELGNRRLPGHQRGAIERAAINAPIQGTAADIIKIAMIQLDRALARDALTSRMILQVHDELVLEGPGSETETVTALLRQVMEGAYPLRVPLKVDVETGPNWNELAKT